MLALYKSKIKQKIPYFLLRNYFKLWLGSEYAEKIHYKGDEAHTMKFNKKHNCIFVHIPKTAGTSVAQSLFGNYPHLHFTVQEYKALYGKQFFNKAFKFTFIRNPWERFFSAYSYIKQQIDDNNPKDIVEQIIIESKNFDEFVEEGLLKKNIQKRCNLFFPQHTFIYSNNKLLVDFIGRYEDLEKDLVKIRKKLEVPFRELQYFNKSSDSDYKDIFTAKSIEIVSDIYKDDIRKFNYTF